MSATLALAKKTKFHFLNIGRIIAKQSNFKIIFILIFAIGFESGLYMLFLNGFEFLYGLGGARLMIISRLFSLAFLGMGIMLILSSIATSYSTIFRSGEIPFLLTRPFKTSQIVMHKFLESTYLSSWAFLFIIIPFVGAYAFHEKVSPLFALWTFLFSVPFLFLCSGIGTLIMLIFVRWFPRQVLARVFFCIGLVLLSAFFWWFKEVVRVDPNTTTFNLSRLIPGLNIASNKFLPSWAVSEGIMTFSRCNWLRGTMLGILLISNMLLAVMAVEWLGSRIFFKTWQSVSAGVGGKSYSKSILTSIYNRCSFLPPDVRALVFKDIRVFFRDPMQWSQVLIFFGLLGLYFLNLRTLNYHEMPEKWRNIITFLNVFSMATIMGSVGSRFVFPQLSIEGQSFWILGLSPVKMKKILLTKFTTTLIGMIIISVSLMLLSSGMIKADFNTKIIAVVLAISVSLAVSGLSVGLGAVFIDLTNRNPIAIVSGFGGTLNLALCLGYILASIFPFGFTWHLQFVNKITSSQADFLIILSGAWLIILTLITTIVPLWLGNKVLKSMDF